MKPHLAVVVTMVLAGCAVCAEDYNRRSDWTTFAPPENKAPVASAVEEPSEKVERKSKTQSQ